ncbi:phage tail assembly chaperone [Bacillus paralicheniformis]|uniref:phage tail assembly chaperone n=1 Tax=Bacillus paralicheniformis TaxID=1648923 RepID=UPI003D252FA6
MFSGWRYLQMKPEDVYALTPREFHILIQAQTERNGDELERKAFEAIMREKAHREKNPKPSDLYKRDSADSPKKKTVEEMAEQAKHTAEWLSQFDIARKEVNE